MILEAAISSLNRFQDTLWIQFACSYCTFTAASWIIFQSCLNRVLLYYIASQASEKKIISWNWMSLERSEIWWVSVWTLHKTLLIIFHVLHGLNKVGSGPEWLAVSWVSASLRAPNTGRHKTHGYYIRKCMWPSLDLISFCIIWKCISKMKYGFFVLYVTPPQKKKKKSWDWAWFTQMSILFICYSLYTVVCQLQIYTCPQGLSVLAFQPDFYEWCRHLNVPSASSLEDQWRGSLWSLSHCLLSFPPCVKCALSERVRLSEAVGGGWQRQPCALLLGQQISG